jgi:hypothetical protein
MRLLQAQGLAGLFLAAVLCMPAWADTNNASSNSAVPGTVNYVEGQVFAGDQQLDQKSVRNVNVEAGQTLSTETGKAEILLTPGVFLREGDNSEVKMVTAGLADTEVHVTHGHAIVEVDQIYPQNNLQIVEGNATARIMKPGLYDFDLRQNQMRVFDGELTVRQGDKQIKLKKGHDLMVAADASEKPAKFNEKSLESDDLYRWSSLRSDYVAEANVDEGRTIVADPWWDYGAGWGWGWGGWGGGWGLGWGGWAWDPWFASYTFMPWNGICYSPFGWGFYSPGLVYRAPFYGGHFYHTFNSHDVRAWGPGQHYAMSSHYAHGVYTGAGATRGAFHSGPVMASRGGFGGFHGGGFHGGAGAFHGGGGGFHGGGGGFHGGGGFGGGGHGR